MEEELEQPEKMDKGVRTILIVFAALAAVTLPCCCLLGFRWNWIMWRLGQLGL